MYQGNEILQSAKVSFGVNAGISHSCHTSLQKDVLGICHDVSSSISHLKCLSHLPYVRDLLQDILSLSLDQQQVDSSSQSSSQRKSDHPIGKNTISSI